MKKIILFILFAVTIQAQTYNVGQTNANTALALSQALAQSDSNTVYRNAINLKFNIADTSVFVSDALLNALLAYKQNTLVSGTNIKTVNGVTILGSGDLTVTGGVDSSITRDLALEEITTKLDTMASDTSIHTMEEIDKAVDNTLYSVIKLNPESSTTFTLLRTKAETIVDSVFCLVQGASASVDFNIAYGTNRTSGTDIFGSDQTADNVTVGETFSTFSSATIPVNNMIWLDITTATNTPTEFLCVIYYH